jgi:hypothetical protein
VSRLEGLPELAGLDARACAPRAVELAAEASGYDGGSTADELDEAAWAAEDRGDLDEYGRLWAQARAASAREFLARGEFGEALYEAAYAFERPEELAALLR